MWGEARNIVAPKLWSSDRQVFSRQYWTIAFYSS